jgi:hypothetical protein
MTFNNGKSIQCAFLFLDLTMNMIAIRSKKGGVDGIDNLCVLSLKINKLRHGYV